MAALERPRRVLMMVPAGKPVDDAIAHLKPALQPGDILIDGGNSWFLDTERRNKALAAEGFHYIGTGVSGGEEGALWGPSIMPGGQREAYDAVAPIFRRSPRRRRMASRASTTWAPLGAGHYVKMVHNGIEYGDMQLIAEVYDLLHRGLGLTAAELHEVFAEWNAGELESYLIEITANIFKKVDPETGTPVVDLILDEAAQKGTGKWTSQNALDVGAPIPTINAAVESRIVSALKSERVAASKVLRGPSAKYTGDKQALIDAARAALYASKITSYAQGLSLLRLASAEYKYDLRPGPIAKVWRARLHHPGDAARRHHGRLRSHARPGEPAAGRRVPRGGRDAAGEVAPRRADRGGTRHPRARVERVARLLRRVPLRSTAREPHAGAARLLRRAHLPSRRQGRRVPHGVDL